MRGFRRLLLWGLWAVVAANLAACGALQTEALQARLRDPSLARQTLTLPERAELSQTPFFPQTEYHCGPAALATVLVAEGYSVTPDSLAESVYLPARKGSLQTEMLVAGRRAGAVSTRVPDRLEDVLQEVASGHPVLVFLNLGLSWVPVWHYAVIVGYDLRAGEVILRSGAREREVMRLRTFEHIWVRAGSWAFGVRRPGQWPATAQEKAVVEASVGFERVAPPGQAAEVYRSAMARWPGNLTLQVGLGNSLYADGQKLAAAEVYRAAAASHRSVPAWVNLADTLLELGDRVGAQEALTQAELLDDPGWRTQVEALRARVGPTILP